MMKSKFLFLSALSVLSKERLASQPRNKLHIKMIRIGHCSKSCLAKSSNDYTRIFSNQKSSKFHSNYNLNK